MGQSAPSPPCQITTKPAPVCSGVSHSPPFSCAFPLIDQNDRLSCVADFHSGYIDCEQHNLVDSHYVRAAERNVLLLSEEARNICGQWTNNNPVERALETTQGQWPLGAISEHCEQSPDEGYLVTYPFSMKSPDGRVVTVSSECAEGKCFCVYMLDGVRNQLKPCRFANVLLTSGEDFKSRYLHVLWFVMDGVPIVDEQPEPYRCENYASITCSENKVKMDQIVDKELAEGMISVSSQEPICVHSLRAVPKGNGGIRHITDCSRPKRLAVNYHCDKLFREFSFKNVNNVIEMLSQDDFMTVIDIKAAYRAVPIKPEHRKYQGFSWPLNGENRWFVENRLCFGLRLGPMYFNFFSNFIYDKLASMDVNVVNYLDDFIAVAPTESACASSQRIIVDLLRYLGFHIAFDKLVNPSTCVTFLGIVIDSCRMELRLPPGKIEKLRGMLLDNLSKKRISKKELESLGGMLSHCSTIIRGSKVFCRRVYALYKEIVNKNARFIVIPDNVKADLQWWLKFSSYFNGTAKIVVESYEFPMVSDSSLRGFAAYLGVDWLAGTWQDDYFVNLCSPCNHVVSRPLAERFDKNNINVLELWPIVQGIKRWANLLRDKSIYVFTDNTQVMFMLLNGNSSNVTCYHWLRELFWLTAIYNIVIIPRYINTKSNLVADTLSRLPYVEVGKKLVEYLSGSNLCCLSKLFDNYRNHE